MIKICSLDFLNREEFGTDVMTADGSVLFRSEDKITPDILLRLYFKEIYVDESFFKEEAKVAVGVGATVKEAVTETVSNVSSLETNAEEKTGLTGPRHIEGRAEVEEETISSDIKSTEGWIHEKEEEQTSGPRHVEGRVEEADNETVSSDTRPAEGWIYEKDEEQTSGPRHVDVAEKDKQEKKHFYSTVNATDDAKTKIASENPENEPLVFDEKQAKRIVEHSLKIGKMLKFSDIELKELEQVAYHFNIGIINFTKSDLAKKGFRKMKAFASYEKLVSEGVVSEEIAEMVKFCANNYESDTFPLNSKIPCQHIVALVSFYEELLSQNNSKQATLLKMLQIGGNQFNIFILHKFIKIMRETNG